MRELFIIFVIIFLGIQGGFVYCLYLKRKVQDWLEIGIIFETIYSIYALIGAWNRVWAKNISLDTLLTYCFLSMAGALFFNIGYLLVKIDNSQIKTDSKVIFFPKVKKVKLIAKKKEIILFALLALLCVANKEMLISMVAGFGTGTSYVMTAIREERTAFSGFTSLVSSYFTNMILAFCFYKIYKHGCLKWCYIVPVAIIGTYYLTSGGRTVLFFIAMLFLLLINYYGKNLRMYQLILFGSMGIIAMILLGHLRAANSISGMIGILQNSDISSLINVRSSGEFYNTTGTLFTYIDAVSTGSFNYNFGISYLTELLIFIPYFIFPWRPKPLPEQYMEIFYPDAPAGTGHGWFILNDGYMAFGIAGVMVEMFLFGIMLAYIYKFFVKHNDKAILKILYAYLCVYMLITVRGSVLSSIKVYILEMLPLIIIFLILQWGKKGGIKENEVSL